jgi:hypothetical protein
MTVEVSKKDATILLTNFLDYTGELRQTSNWTSNKHLYLYTGGNALNSGKILALTTTFIYVQLNLASLALFDGFIKAVNGNEGGLYAEATRRSLEPLNYYVHVDFVYPFI